MPRVKLTKTVIDALPTPPSDIVYWDAALPGFGVKVTPKGRKVFIVLYRTGGAGAKLRKYTLGPYGQVTLHQARTAAQKVFAARRAPNRGVSVIGHVRAQNKHCRKMKIGSFSARDSMQHITVSNVEWV
jgi:Arm DNA-binding domain